MAGVSVRAGVVTNGLVPQAAVEEYDVIRPSGPIGKTLGDQAGSTARKTGVGAGRTKVRVDKPAM
jgi:hypothetical protein